MADKTLTHKDLGDALNVSVTTVKSYRRKFPGYIPVAGYGKPIRFQPKALEVCTKIRECFEQGLSVTETEKRLRQAGFRSETSRRDTASPGSAPGTTDGASVVSGAVLGAGVSPEYMDKFFKTAGQMMQGMAQLATAQARSEQRLSRLEEALRGLLEAEAGNQVLLGELAAGFRTDRSQENTVHEGSAHIYDDQDTQEQDQLVEQDDRKESRVRAKKIVNVRGKDGIDSYTLENGESADHSLILPKDSEDAERPEDGYLAMPVAIRSDQGDFLGLPGRLSLGDFTGFLVRLEGESGPVLSTWKGVGNAWTLSLRNSSGQRRELGFSKHTTNRGVELAVLMHLNRNGAVADRDELMEFFREMKDLIHQQD